MAMDLTAHDAYARAVDDRAEVMTRLHLVECAREMLVVGAVDDVALLRAVSAYLLAMRINGVDAAGLLPQVKGALYAALAEAAPQLPWAEALVVACRRTQQMISMSTRLCGVAEAA